MDCTCDYCTGKKEYHYEGVAGLEQGERMSLEPQNLLRHYGRKNKRFLLFAERKVGETMQQVENKLARSRLSKKRWNILQMESPS